MRHDDIILDMVKKTVEDKEICPDFPFMTLAYYFFFKRVECLDNAIRNHNVESIKKAAIAVGAALIKFLENIENYQEEKDGITRVG